jgi:hypothetical protein
MAGRSQSADPAARMFHEEQFTKMFLVEHHKVTLQDIRNKGQWQFL